MIFTKQSPGVTPVTTDHSFTSIREYLARKSMTVESTGLCDEKYNIAALADFAQKLIELQTKGGGSFLKYIRTAIVQKDCRCSFSLKHLSDEEQKACIDIANLLCAINGLTNAVERNGILQGHFTFLNSPRLINFLNGDFAEIAIYTITKRVLTEYARSHSVAFELLPNLVVTSDAGKREYDLLARVGSDLYVIEIKSGKAENLLYYKKRGCELGIPPDHQILVTSDRSENDMELISYFEEFHLAGPSDFADKLRNILKIREF